MSHSGQRKYLINGELLTQIQVDRKYNCTSGYLHDCVKRGYSAQAAIDKMEYTKVTKLWGIFLKSFNSKNIDCI